MHFIMQAVYVFVLANIISQVTLMSSNVRMGLFYRISVLSNFVVKDSSLWTFNDVLSATHCTGHCVLDLDCNSVFYNSVTGVCIGHSTVHTTPKTASAEPGSNYFSKNKPEGPDTGTSQGQGDIYTYHNETMAWDDARVECQKDGGDLVSFDTPEKLMALTDYFVTYKQSNNVANSVWVGVRKHTMDGLFYWASSNVLGSTVTWASGQPSSITERQCGYTSPFEDFVMRTYLCSHSLAFICETSGQ